jgi:hypothetical protein
MKPDSFRLERPKIAASSAINFNPFESIYIKRGVTLLASRENLPERRKVELFSRLVFPKREKKSAFPRAKKIPRQTKMTQTP